MQMKIFFQKEELLLRLFDAISHPLTGNADLGRDLGKRQVLIIVVIKQRYKFSQALPIILVIATALMVLYMLNLTTMMK